MRITDNLNQMEMIECVKTYGFGRGSQVYFLHKFRNLPNLYNKRRQYIEYEMVENLRICSKSTFDKVWALYNKVHTKLIHHELDEILKKHDERATGK